ncbi:MAG: hypothetical protein ACE37F_29995 [Nannocystaceae bacterium]|nr:hypothetical protein [bacterium]
MIRRLFTFGLALPLTACGSVVDFPNVDGSTGSSAESTSGPDVATSAAPDPTSNPVPTTSTPTTGPGPDPTTSAGAEGSSESGGCFFLDCEDTESPPAIECSIWEQNCPEGEKCSPWANDGGNWWNATRCVPIAGNPDGLYEPCTVEDTATSGLDSCDFGMMCWNISEELTGTCHGLCQGSEQAPTCADDNATCVVGADSVIPLCLPNCNPLDPDSCGPTEGCYPTNSGDFHCVPDASGKLGGVLDECQFVNACDPGLFCAPASVVSECEGTGCCMPFCSLAEPVCPEMTSCVPFFAEGEVPPGYEDLGACISDPA